MTDTTATTATVDLDPAVAEQIKIRTAPAWRPESGDTITGSVIRLAARSFEAIGNQPARDVLVMTLDTGTGGYVNVFGFHAVLMGQLAELKPSAGDRLTIAYHGKVQPKGDKPAYHNYTVINPDAPGTADTFSWDAVTPSDAPGF